MQTHEDKLKEAASHQNILDMCDMLQEQHVRGVKVDDIDKEMQEIWDNYEQKTLPNYRDISHEDKLRQAYQAYENRNGFDHSEDLQEKFVRGQIEAMERQNISDACVMLDDHVEIKKIWNSYKNQPSTFEPPNYRRLALEQAGKLPNTSVAELLANADKIERWLSQTRA